MGKFRVVIRTKFGEISVEGDSRKETFDLIKEAIDLESDVSTLVPEERVTPILPTALVPSSIPPSKKELEGVIEVTVDGRPHITVAPGELAGREVVGLLLYWKCPEGLSAPELKELVSLNWKSVDQPRITSIIAELRGLVLKEGPRGKFVYKISGAGKSWVETNLLPKLKNEKRKS